MYPTVYWIEYPDKDLAVMVVDDGTRQEVITGSPDQRDEPPSQGLLSEFYHRDFLVHAFTSWLEETPSPITGRRLRRWRRIDENGEPGEIVYPGELALGPGFSG